MRPAKPATGRLAGKAGAGAAVLAAMLALAALAGPARTATAGDSAAGEKVFQKCKACHLVDQEKHRIGPHLIDLFGRPAGSLGDFKKYSEAMKASGIVWDEETLDGYLESPRKYVKGGNMAFAGLKKKEDRANVIAYLKGFSGQ